MQVKYGGLVCVLLRPKVQPGGHLVTALSQNQVEHTIHRGGINQPTFVR